jgi:phosphate:Na+ symporter
VISLLAGLAFFLYGITLMGDGLNLVAGNRLESVLFRLTSNRARGILLGTLVTAVIQSSSAVSVMCVGFVNSGLMQFAQAVSVILGSILGTSVTGWIICLSSLGGGV